MTSPILSRHKSWLLVGALALAAYLVGAMQTQRGGALWVQRLANAVGLATPSPTAVADEHDHAAHEDSAGEDHAGHDHAADAHAEPTAGADEHAHDEHDHAHSEETSLELSPEALANLGLTPDLIQPIEETSYVRRISVPAIVVERPGRTQHPVSAPLSGVVTSVHAVTGEAIMPGDLLFELRLIHEELVTAQKEFLQGVGNLAVEEKEIGRLQTVAASGALPAKVLLERKYARDKLLATLASDREALRLHGLSAQQIETIERERRLLTTLKIYAPQKHPAGGKPPAEVLKLSGTQRVIPIQHTEFIPVGAPKEVGALNNAASAPLIVKALNFNPGETVDAGQVLCVLADYSLLYVKGQAFETDAAAVAEAKRRGLKATAETEHSGKRFELENLEIAYLGNEVDSASRTLEFFVTLKNSLTADETSGEGQRYVSWKFRPGERMQLRVPVEELKDQLVLPVDAVVKEGPDSFIFMQNGEHFDRVAVHEVYRDRRSVVIANDGALFPGDVVALRGAHQMQLALKNKAGGGIDPHAGHNH